MKADIDFHCRFHSTKFYQNPVNYLVSGSESCVNRGTSCFHYRFILFSLSKEYKKI
jgi:hypothetical protein